MTIPPDILADIAAALDAMPDPTRQRQVDALEAELASRFASCEAVAVASGTAALHTALHVLGVGPGDDVLVPALSVVMSVAPITYCGARPVFVDCSADGPGMDMGDLERKITPRSRAVLPVHLWGRTANLLDVLEVAADHGLPVVEDACQAQGSTIDGRAAGTLTDLGCFSMKDGKVLWSGEGGYLLTDDSVVAARCRAFRSHGLPPPVGEPPALGHNYRLAEPLSALARGNLHRFDTLLARRRGLHDVLAAALADVPGVRVLPAPDDQGWNRFCLLAALDVPRPREFAARLAAVGVVNSVGSFHLIPANQRPVFAWADPAPCPRAAALVDRTLAVSLSDADDETSVLERARIIRQEALSW